MARGFKVADAYVEITVDKDAVRDSAKGIPSAVGPDLDRAGTDMGKRLGKSLGDESKRQGDDAGGKLALGMRMSIIRNSPLIVAAAGTALALGGPAMLAGATALFAGLGIAAGAQAEQVGHAWSLLMSHMGDEAKKAGLIISPVLIGIADQVGRAFDRMMPQVESAFRAAAPQIRVFADGLISLAENALPGLVRAVQASMPVTQGLADFMGKVGTGLSDFFDRISAHAPAAGSAFSSLGDMMASLLPTLGELLGQGAELAAVALPALSHGLGLVLTVVTALGPLIPALATAFGAFKVVQSIGGWMTAGSVALSGFADRLAATSWQGELAASGVRKVGSVISGLGSALPLVGAAIGVVTAAIATNEQRTSAWAQALLKGGAAAAAAQKQMEEAPSAWDRFSFAITHSGNSMGVVGKQTHEAEQAMKDMLASMDPVSRTSALLTQAENDLSFALEKHGAGSKEVVSAQSAYDVALAASEEANGRLEEAVQGVTDAMIKQADQALASIDSGFAYRSAVDQLEDAQTALNDAIRDHGGASEEAQRAQLALEEQTFRTAEAFGKQQADLSGLQSGTAQYTDYANQQTLAMLQQLQQSAGPEMAAAIQQQINALQRGGVSVQQSTTLAATLSGQMRDLAGSIQAVPGQKYVQIDAPTAAQISQIQALGYYVQTLPNGSIRVYANTADAENAINYAARARTATVYLRQVGAALAEGGVVHPIIKAAAGRIVGPGGPTEDKVPAIGPGGAPWALSDGEVVVRESVSRQQGYAKMAALNAGQADVVPRGTSSGGPSRGGSSGNTYNVNISGTWDFASPRAARAVAEKVRDALINLEREQQ